MSFKKYTTYKFVCYYCGRKKMFPNESEGKIMGYVCAHCGMVNYPVKEKPGIIK